MKTLKMIVATFLLFFLVSAGGAIGWKMLTAPKKTAESTEEEAKADATAEGKSEPAAAEGEAKPEGEKTASASTAPSGTADTGHVPVDAKPIDEDDLPAGIRPGYTPGAEDAIAASRYLNDKLKQLRREQANFDQEQQSFKLVFEDLRQQQGDIEGVRELVNREMSGLQSALKDLEARQKQFAEERAKMEAMQKDLSDQKAALDDRDQKVEKQTTKITPADEPNLKMLGNRYDKMPADAAAKVMRQMVKDDYVDTVVQLLSQMKDRQSAKLLALLGETDPAMASDLTQRLKGLKRPDKPKTGTGAPGAAAAPPAANPQPGT